QQRACPKASLGTGSAECVRCRASLSQLESDLAAVDGLKAEALRRLEEASYARGRDTPVKRVRLAPFFPSPLDSAAGVEEGLQRLREHLLKELAEGSTVIPE